MQLTKKQKAAVQTIQAVLGVSLSVSASRRNVVTIQVADEQMARDIERVCFNYKIGRVAPNGVQKIAVII